MSRRTIACAVAVAALALSAIVVSGIASRSGPNGSEASAPTSPGPVVCGNASILNGPSAAPSGAVTIAAGTNVNAVEGSALKPNTVYWFAAGTHTIGTGMYDAVQPQSGDTFTGAPGAVINGQDKNNYAFESTATNVTIEYLTVENFTAPQSQGVVNQNSAANWSIVNDTIENNPYGAGAMLGTDNTLNNDCLTSNGQYGFQTYSAAGSHTVTVTNNEISYNDTANYTETTTGCGCTGGAKFWATTGGTVTGNYVHNNYSVGLWFDTNNSGFNISDNYFATNYAEGVMYEVSYNAQITDNTFVRNAIGEGPTNPGFPTGAIYISESGSDPRISGPYDTTFIVSGNNFTNNWSGVVLWENSNRYCGSSANPGTACTLVTPKVYSYTSCQADVPASTPTGSPDYFDNCRWKTENVDVSGNTFNFTPSAVSPKCSPSTACGLNAIFSEYGTYSPFKAWVVPNNISNNQDNHFSDNAYTGPWKFLGFNQGEIVSWTQWTKGFADSDGSGDHFGAQDAGSTFSSSPGAPIVSAPPPPTTTTGTKTGSTTTGTKSGGSTTTGTKTGSTTTGTKPGGATTTGTKTGSTTTGTTPGGSTTTGTKTGSTTTGTKPGGSTTTGTKTGSTTTTSSVGSTDPPAPPHTGWTGWGRRHFHYHGHGGRSLSQQELFDLESF